MFMMEYSVPTTMLKVPTSNNGPRREEEGSAPHPEKPAVGNYHTHQQRSAKQTPSQTETATEG